MGDFVVKEPVRVTGTPSALRRIVPRSRAATNGGFVGHDRYWGCRERRPVRIVFYAEATAGSAPTGVGANRGTFSSKAIHVFRGEGFARGAALGWEAQRVGGVLVQILTETPGRPGPTREHARPRRCARSIDDATRARPSQTAQCYTS